MALRKDEKIGDVLLLLEHAPVITLGRNANAANVVAAPELLAKRGCRAFRGAIAAAMSRFTGPDRSSDTPSSTCAASPLPEGKRKMLGIIEFVRRLEEVLIRTCADFAIPSEASARLDGVWTSAGSANADGGTAVSSARRSEAVPPDKAPPPAEAKLAAIGIHISRFVTSHGFALNVNTDLSYFNLIIPCGITNKPVTSMQQKLLGHALSLNAVAKSIFPHVGQVFSSQMLWVETVDALLGHTVGVPIERPTELRRLHREDDTTLGLILRS